MCCNISIALTFWNKSAYFVVVFCVVMCSVEDSGLHHILYHYGTCRGEVYKRLFTVLWFGNGVGKASSSNSSPTYIYPEDLRLEVRRRFPTPEATGRDKEFEGQMGTYKVTWDDIQSAKWPRPPKSCAACVK